MQVKNPIKNTTLISKKYFDEVLKVRFGLTIDKDSINKYIDNYNCNSHTYNEASPKVFTATFTDSFGFSWSNTQGRFYKKHTEPKSELFKEFKEFINTHTFIIDKHFYI
jgi:hypothetical protein